MSFCSRSTVASGTCTGRGCCQTSIPKGLNYYRVRFDPNFNNSDIWYFSRCSYAFLVEEEWFKFDTSDVTTTKLLQNNGARVPLVIDWAIGNIPCEEAKKNLTSYACLSEHSECADSTNGPGYLCNCSSGYQGNPYRQNGCQDINECEHPEKYHCYGSCENLQGTYNCTCPSGSQGDPSVKRGCTCPTGTQGDPYAQGGCRPISQRNFPLWLIFVIGGLSIFIVASITCIAFEKVKFIKAKQKCFQQNGGLLLQQQINTHQGVKFKIFTEQQMERATNNFHPSQVLGRGGHGIVYRGYLDGKMEVAIKKAMLTTENQKNEFAKEMYTVSLINHRNVVKILGCCLEVEVPMLVYEFVPNGTLFQHIHDKKLRMPLEVRLKVAIESAAALAYLHSDASPEIRHGDVKSSNILLNEDYTPKLSDFGASLLDKCEAEYGQGTPGYVDPEYMQTGELTRKSDVYSFAVVLLELLTRRKVVQSNGYGSKISLVSTFTSSVKENIFQDMLDDEVHGELGTEQIGEVAELLKQCLSFRGIDRPTMKEVAAWLERLSKLKRSPWVKHNPEDRGKLLDESTSYHTPDTTKYHSLEIQSLCNINAGR